MKKASLILAFLASAILALAPLTAFAITGGKPARSKNGVRRSVVRIENSVGELCTGVLVSQNVALTAAHCVEIPANYSAVFLDGRFRPHSIAITAILKHPSFVSGTEPSDQPGTDLALVKLTDNVPADMAPAPLVDHRRVTPGTDLFLVGYGSTSYRNERSVRVLRVATVTTLAVDQPPNNLIVAADGRRLGVTAGAGTCRGDSGGPVLMDTARGFAVAGIVSWSAGATRARDGSPCGGTTAITPIASHLGWIERGMQRLQW